MKPKTSIISKCNRPYRAKGVVVHVTTRDHWACRDTRPLQDGGQVRELVEVFRRRFASIGAQTTFVSFRIYIYIYCIGALVVRFLFDRVARTKLLRLILRLLRATLPLRDLHDRDQWLESRFAVAAIRSLPYQHLHVRSTYAQTPRWEALLPSNPPWNY